MQGILKARPPLLAEMDVVVQPITMKIGALESDPTTIARGLTATYQAVILNPSQGTAHVVCSVSVAGVPLSFPQGVNVFDIPEGETATCVFPVSYPDLQVKEIVVTAVVSSPTDVDLTNNTARVVTTPLGNDEFVGVQSAFVKAQETRDFELTGLTEDPQLITVANLALFVTDATSPIGEFKLVGKASSGGQVFSVDSVGGTDNPLASPYGLPLNPKTDVMPSCIRQTRIPTTSVNSHAVTLEICAAPVPNEGNRQAITVSYTSAKSGAFPVSLEPVFFGNSISVEVELIWRLKNAPAGVTDKAFARIEFPLESFDVGGRRKRETGCFRVYNRAGTSYVPGGGPGCT
jgi:hypothetical protein